MNTSNSTQHKLKILRREHRRHGKLNDTLIAGIFDSATTDFEAFEHAASDLCLRNEQTKEMGIEIAHWLVRQPTEASQKAGADLMWSIAEDGRSRASILALIDVAELMFEGKGRPVDPVSAIDRLYRANYAAEDGELVALSFAAIAKVWAHGKCGLVDHEWAQHYFQVAADLDVVEPAYETGLFFDSPNAGGSRHSSEPDYDAASLYYSVAYEAGHLAARTRLGIILTSGVLADADFEVGIELLEESANEGDEMAVETLRVLRSN
jgi:TPR repeat protein